MPNTTIHPQDVLNAMRKHFLLVLAPVVALTGAAVLYAILRPATWEAAQALVVRSETGDSQGRIGKITQLEDMKSTQETIMELAKSRSVLTNALTAVGPREDEDSSGHWPTELALEALQQSVSVEPPKGAEFGKTEVFYLKVKDHSRERAIAIDSAICTQLQDRLSALREATANGSIRELERSAELARDELNKSSDALSKIEKQVGTDLAELRILSDSPSGDSDLRRNLVELEKELRSYKATQVENEESLNLLREAQADPDKLLASPTLLIKSQPALGRLKDGLVDAQLRSGQALGTMSEDHPMVLGAREAERVIREQLYGEIALAIKGAEADLHIGVDRIESVEQQISEIQNRLSKLVHLRVEYAQLAEAVKNRSETAKAVDRELADARATQAAAQATSRISFIDVPDAGTRPIGPGKTAIAAAGFGGGILVAAAILFLLINPAPLLKESESSIEPPSEAIPLSIGSSPDRPASTAKLSLSQALQRVAS